MTVMTFLIGYHDLHPNLSMPTMTHTVSHLQLSGKIFVLCGLWLVALGAYFLFFRPALLPEDSRYIGRSLEAIRLAVPGLELWLRHVFNVMGGFMIASGLMTTLMACRLSVRRDLSTFTILALSGAVGVGLMSLTNFLLNSNFRWLLVLPVLLWLVGLVCYRRERITFAAPNRRPDQFS